MSESHISNVRIKDPVYSASTDVHSLVSTSAGHERDSRGLAFSRARKCNSLGISFVSDELGDHFLVRWSLALRGSLPNRRARHPGCAAWLTSTKMFSNLVRHSACTFTQSGPSPSTHFAHSKRDRGGGRFSQREGDAGLLAVGAQCPTVAFASARKPSSPESHARSASASSSSGIRHSIFDIRHSPRGASTLEFAIALIVFMLLVFAIIEWVNYTASNLILTKSAQNGLRVAERIDGVQFAPDETDPEKIQRYQSALTVIELEAKDLAVNTLLSEPGSGSMRELVPFYPSGVEERAAMLIRPGESFEYGGHNSGNYSRHPSVCPEGYSGPDSADCKSFYSPGTNYEDLLRNEPLVVEVRATVEPLFFKFIGTQEIRARAVGFRKEAPKGAYPKKPGSTPGEEETTTSTVTSTTMPPCIRAGVASRYITCGDSCRVGYGSQPAPGAGLNCCECVAQEETPPEEEPEPTTTTTTTVTTSTLPRTTTTTVTTTTTTLP